MALNDTTTHVQGQTVLFTNPPWPSGFRLLLGFIYPINLLFTLVRPLGRDGIMDKVMTEQTFILVVTYPIYLPARLVYNHLKGAYYSNFCNGVYIF